LTYLAMGGQIVDATVIEARRPRLSGDEKRTIKGGGVPGHWSKAKRSQMDTQGRWTLKRRKKRQGPSHPSSQKRQATVEILVPLFGYKNRIGIDPSFGLIRTFAVTHAAADDGGQLAALLDRDNLPSGVWADSAYRSQPTSNCSTDVG
jgi:hypothetical protein